MAKKKNAKKTWIVIDFDDSNRIFVPDYGYVSKDKILKIDTEKNTVTFIDPFGRIREMKLSTEEQQNKNEIDAQKEKNKNIFSIFS